MRFFALETDKDKVIERFCSHGECVVHMTYYHGLSFFFAILRDLAITTILFATAIIGILFGWPVLWTLGFFVFVLVHIFLF